MFRDIASRDVRLSPPKGVPFSERSLIHYVNRSRCENNLIGETGGGKLVFFFPHLFVSRRQSETESGAWHAVARSFCAPKRTSRWLRLVQSCFHSKQEHTPTATDHPHLQRNHSALFSAHRGLNNPPPRPREIQLEITFFRFRDVSHVAAALLTNVYDR